MAIKVLEAKGSKKETSSTLDFLSDVAASRAVKKEIQQEVGEFIKEQVLLKVGSGESPIKGESFAKLTAKYKAKKIAEGGTPIPNMELSGATLNSLDYEVTKDGIKIGIFGERAWAADGHNHFSQESANAIAPKRRYLPGEGQSFDKSIEQGIESIISDKLLENGDVNKQDLELLTSKKSFYDYFSGIMGEELSRSELRLAILRNKQLVDMLDDLDLLEFLE